MATNESVLIQFILLIIGWFYLINFAVITTNVVYSQYSKYGDGYLINAKYFSAYIRSKEIDRVNKFKAIMHIVILYLLGPITAVFCFTYLAYYAVSSVCEYIIKKIFKKTYNDYVEEYLKYACTALMISSAMLRYAPDK